MRKSNIMNEDYKEVIDPVTNAVYLFSINKLVAFTKGNICIDEISEEDNISLLAIMASLVLEHGREQQPLG